MLYYIEDLFFIIVIVRPLEDVEASTSSCRTAVEVSITPMPCVLKWWRFAVNTLWHATRLGALIRYLALVCDLIPDRLCLPMGAVSGNRLTWASASSVNQMTQFTSPE